MELCMVFLVSLTVLGAFAKPQSNTFQSNDFNKAYCPPLPVVTTHIQTPVVENPTIEFPSFIPPTTISESCHHLKTVARPQIHNEIITVPTVDSIARTVPSSIVETRNSDEGSRLAIFTKANNLLSAVVAGQNFSEKNSNKNNSDSGSSRQAVFLTNHNNEANNGMNIDLVARPTFLVQSASAKNLNVVTANSPGSNSFQDSVGTRK